MMEKGRHYLVSMDVILKEINGKEALRKKGFLAYDHKDYAGTPVERL
jgi:hypothetical protein